MIRCMKVDYRINLKYLDIVTPYYTWFFQPLWAISSGFTLFAKIFVLVYSSETVTFHTILHILVKLVQVCRIN